MEGPNYFRAAMEYILRTNKGKKLDEDLKFLVEAGPYAPKFALPDGGKILDNGLKCLPAKLRLPYPVVVLEYYHKEAHLKGIAELASQRHVDDRILQLFSKGHAYRDKIIVLASQVDDGRIEVTIMHHTADLHSWTSGPGVVTMPTDGTVIVELLNSGTLFKDVVQTTDIDRVWFEALCTSMMTGPLTALLELLEALSFSNITEVEIPAKKQTFTEKRKKALPYDSYRALVVNKTEVPVSAGRTEPGPCGERRMAREHTRRGHDRTYKSGKKIWINPMVINAGVGGKIVKDYIVK